MNDTATIVTIVSAVTGVLTVLLTKGVDAALKWYRARHEMQSATCHEEDERADVWAKVVIAQQQKEIDSLRADVRQILSEMNAIRAEHMNCEKAQAELKAEVAFLRRQVGQQ